MSIPSQAFLGICPPVSFTKKAAKIGCVATIAVPAVTLVSLIERKNPTKCTANTTPANIAQRTPVRFNLCRRAKGRVTSDPPRFLQKISVGTGIALSAMRGPDEPMPKIPIIRRMRSGLAGNCV